MTSLHNLQANRFPSSDADPIERNYGNWGLQPTQNMFCVIAAALSKNEEVKWALPGTVSTTIVHVASYYNSARTRLSVLRFWRSSASCTLGCILSAA